MPKISSSGTGLDIHRRVPVFRSPSVKAAVGTIAAVSGAADTKRCKSANADTIDDYDLASSAPGAQTARKVVKRSLNIPICEVTYDAEYEREVRPTYELPASYVKHVKKVGGEADLSLEYVADRDDEVWLKSTEKSSPAVPSQLLTVSSFEAMVNLLERFTAHSKELLPLTNALKIVNDEFSSSAVVPGWGAGSAELVVPVVYHYWASKRARMGKPLCRRYWPAVTSSDTNPHQVFRTRDKEKYRLRRQHKRNDIIAFRKMQQLRREFSKVTALVQLVLEREMLREAEFELQREVFDQTMLDLQQAECPPVTRAAPYRYSLKNRDLIYDVRPSPLNSNHQLDSRQSLNASNVDLSSLGGGETSARQTGNRAYKHGAALPLKGRAHKHHTTSRRNSAAIAASAPDSSSLAAAPLIEDRLMDAAAGADATSTRKKSDLRKRKRDLNNRGGSQIKFKKWGTGAHKSGSGSGARQRHASNNQWIYSDWKSILTKQEEYKLVSPDLLGPSAVCQPSWPSFMNDLPFRRSEVDTSGSVSKYMSSLDLRVDDVSGAVIAPEKYEARFRIGRGNRLVLDRVPVYANPTSSDCSTPSCYPPNALLEQSFRCIYPTSLYARHPSINYNAFSAKLPGKLLPGPKGLQKGLKVKGRPSEASRPPADLVINAERPNDQDDQSQSARITTTRLLPEIPMSNMKLINMSHRNRQASTGSASSYKSISQQAKLSERIATLPKLPPFNPSARLLLSAEKVQRLQQILAQSDSEDEKTTVEPTATRRSRSTKA